MIQILQLTIHARYKKEKVDCDSNGLKSYITSMDLSVIWRIGLFFICDLSDELEMIKHMDKDVICVIDVDDSIEGQVKWYH